MVETGQTIYLDKPVDDGTIPVIGDNLHIIADLDTSKENGYTIWWSLPSKTGKRVSLFLSTPTFTTGSQLTTDQFYKKNSVEQAILILKSVQY